MEFSQMTQKWSSKPKEDRAARVRENQRRHRARTKTHIAELEQQLADTKAELEQALSRNAELELELKQLHHRAPHEPNSSVPPPLPTVIDSDDLTHNASLLLALGEEQLNINSNEVISSWSSSRNASPQPTNDSSACQPFATSSHISPICGTSDTTSSPCSCDSQAATPQTNAAGAATTEPTHCADPDCSHLPPPAPGESTIRCKTAYSIIEERNFQGMELGDIKTWLGPGLRSATTQGDGCRVDSHLVFALIDNISPN